MQFNFSNSQTKVGGNVASGNTSIAGQNNALIQHFYDSSESADNVKEVLAWLKPHAVDYVPAHEEAHARQTPGTGAWFFNGRTYMIWRGVESCDAGILNLECVGIPGAGKTTLASAVIENLQPAYSTSSSGDHEEPSIVLYVYFRHDTQSYQKIPNVLASLLQQVVRIKGHISEELHNLYKAFSMSGIIPAPDRLIKILRFELSAYHKAFIVVDALDEYSTETYSLSHDLVSHLEQLDARLLITSRHHVDFTPNPFSSVHISARADDIRIMVQDHVKGNLAKIIHRTPGLLEEIVKMVVDKAEGMFIIAKLLIKSIPDLLTSADIRTALKMLPTGLRDTYFMTMKRIWQQKPHIVELAKKALAWVFLAKRRLRMLELQHAVSFRCGGGTLLGEDLIEEEMILSSCLGLVVFVKDEEGIFECQFAHFTAKEFLDTCWQDYFPDGEKQITEICLAYLDVTASAISPTLTERITQMNRRDRDCDDEWKQYKTFKYALCLYAATCWGAHAKAIDAMLPLDAYAHFFEHPMSPYMASDAWHSIIFTPTISMPPVQYWTLYFARFGLLEHLQMHAAVIQNHSSVPEAKVPLNYNDIRDRFGWTALHFAALYGHLKVVEFLLSSGADVNQLNNRDNAPLHLAVQAGSSGVVIAQLLLNHGALVEQPDVMQRAAIFHAIEPQHNFNQPSPDIIRLLLQHEVDIYREGYGLEKEETPLSLAQKSENPKIKKLLEEYARTHPPERRAYKQRFPGGHHSTMDSVSEITSGLDSEPPMTHAAPSITSEREASLTGHEASSTTPDTGVNHDTPTQVATATIFPGIGALQLGPTSRSAVDPLVDVEPPTTTPDTIEPKGRGAKTGFKQLSKSLARSFYRRRK